WTRCGPRARAASGWGCEDDMKALPGKRRRRGRNGEEGQAALELILMFPFFIFLVLLSIDFGLWMYQFVSVSNAVREGARYGAVNCPGSSPCTIEDIRTRTVDRASGALEAADIAVTWVDRDGA